jgi:hypothetical protein
MAKSHRGNEIAPYGTLLAHHVARLHNYFDDETPPGDIFEGPAEQSDRARRLTGEVGTRGIDTTRYSIRFAHVSMP